MSYNSNSRGGRGNFKRSGNGGSRNSSSRNSFNGNRSVGSFSRGRGGSRKNNTGKENIHFSKFVKPAIAGGETVTYVPQNNFADFEIHDLIKKNIIDKGISTPSPIQDQSIPHALSGKDIIGIANTGTGKTLAFTVPVVNKILNNKRSATLILAPTRELAQQIESEFKSIAKGSGVFGTLLIGGSPMRPQFRGLSTNPKVVIGTPGRTKDHMNQGSLDLSRFDTIVLDEFDRMLDMGFINDIRTILSQLSTENRQSLFFSATLDDKVKALSDEFLNDPITVTVSNGNTTDNVSQDVVRCSSKEDKLEKLCQALRDKEARKVLIFDETKHGADRLGKKLVANGFSAGSIHGGKTQGNRARTMREFKSSKISILVATDVAARGIDVSDITHVINYATPRTYTDYIHRIGRAGRAGRTGYALTFIES